MALLLKKVADDLSFKSQANDAEFLVSKCEVDHDLFKDALISCKTRCVRLHLLCGAQNVAFKKAT